jgi:hypothetical protein
MIGEEYFIDILNKNECILISYTYDSYDRIISILNKINVHIIDDKIDDNFKLETYLRDKKIESLILDTNVKLNNHIVLNTNQIEYTSIYDTTYSFGGLNSIFVSNILDNFQQNARDKEIKTIILTPYIKLVDNNYGITGKTRKSLHSSDLFLTVVHDQVEIIKNRREEKIKTFQLN